MSRGWWIFVAWMSGLFSLANAGLVFVPGADAHPFAYWILCLLCIEQVRKTTPSESPSKDTIGKGLRP